LANLKDIVVKRW